MTKIVTVTLNPALDITTDVDQLLSGKKLKFDLEMKILQMIL